MPLRESTGNMYSFVTHTWNPIKGKCFHDCSYCYMKRFPLPDIYLDEKELKTDLGQGNFIFVGSGTDIFADNIPFDWIIRVLDYCAGFKNRYLFQSKNPKRFVDINYLLSAMNVVLGTTIETNRHYENIMCNAPTTHDRATYMEMVIPQRMVTIEPILDFDDSPFGTDNLFDLIDKINPSWVNIGADSKGHNLPEPPAYKVQSLIEKLKARGYEVKLKSNLKRLLNG